MRCLGLIFITAALAGCSAAGIGGSQQSSACAPYCNSFMPIGYPVQTNSQTPYSQSYGQPYTHNYGYHIGHANHQTIQTGYPLGYALHQTAYTSQPSPHAYGTHAYGRVPQLRGLSDPYNEGGYKYGNLGGILYDFDSQKYGIQGRIGYQSASLFGAELEGSISLGAETEELDADANAMVRGLPVPTNTPTSTSTGTGTNASTGTSTLTTEFANSIAAFGLARLPVSDRLSIHSRAGLHSTRFKAELDDGTQVLRQNETSIGIAYGLGMEYAVTPKNNIRLDYTVYDTDPGGNADSLSLSFAHKF